MTLMSRTTSRVAGIVDLACVTAASLMRAETDEIVKVDATPTDKAILRTVARQ
jgi:hypothetical protein